MVKKNMLDESNPLSYLPDGRNVQADWYRLQNREKQIAAIDNLDEAEVAYITGAVSGGDVTAKKAQLKKDIQKVHEKDIIEIRALQYLGRLPDTSPELFTLKAMCGCETREQIASYIAEKQLKKLVMSQVELIAGGESLATAYKGIIKKGPDTFRGLWA